MCKFVNKNPLRIDESWRWSCLALLTGTRPSLLLKASSAGLVLSCSARGISPELVERVHRMAHSNLSAVAWPFDYPFSSVQPRF